MLGAYRHILQKPKRKDALLTASSFLFLMCAFITFYKGAHLLALGMTICFLTSIIYHSTGSKYAFIIDFLCNHFMGIVFTIYAIIIKKYMVVIYALVSILGYLLWPTEQTSLVHLLTVHAPVTVGFLSF